MDHNADFDVFREKLVNCVMPPLKNPGDVVYVVWDMEDPRGNFDNKNISRSLNKYQGKFRVQKIIQEKGIGLFVTREIEIQSNLQCVYGLI